ncbi:MAG: MBL fold metallo-hydrolase [Woeseiaceae bacterium]|nr:MBL fold metallo-hydrolase [Woeseiaceae bacterium]
MTDFGPRMEPYSVLAPGVRRIVAPNPSMMTGPGTNTYLFGDVEVAVLDPGPKIDRHLDDIIDKAGAPIRWIIASHTHPDHSPGVMPLAERTGAEVLGMPAPDGFHQDMSFAPTRQLRHADTLKTAEFRLEVIHTPGHASNHLCFRHDGTNWIFTGDHVIDGSTVVINPPDGNMKQYIDSLRRLKIYEPVRLAPGHGELIDDPNAVIDWIIAHRLEREEKVLKALKAQPRHTARELVPHVYRDVDEKLYGWAERSLLAHLVKLDEDGVAVQDEDDRWSVLE